MHRTRVLLGVIFTLLLVGVSTIALIPSWRCAVMRLMGVQPHFVRYHPDPSRDNTRVPSLVGQSLEQVRRRLGPPGVDRLITLQDANVEFRCELLNFYPPNDPANNCVRIKELWWKKREYTTTVWFHQANGAWVVLDTCRWKKSTKFTDATGFYLYSPCIPAPQLRYESPK